LNDGGSGAFVSPDGLLMTNQHVAGGQLQKVSTHERDYVKNGFYASTRAAEIRCPDLEVNVLVSFENVTGRVQSAVQDGATPTEATEQRRGATAAIEKESTATTGSGSYSRRKNRLAFLAVTTTTSPIRDTISTSLFSAYTRTMNRFTPTTSSGRITALKRVS
jgi:hypothetical protein